MREAIELNDMENWESCIYFLFIDRITGTGKVRVSIYFLFSMRESIASKLLIK
jgi:hypothetical protein